MSHVIRHKGTVSRRDRHGLNRHKSCVLWLTGLSGSGKSTLAHALEDRLTKKGFRSYVLDGDNIRHGLNSDLGFSRQDRKENIRRIVETAKLFVDAGLIAITAFISPYAEDRDTARASFPEGEFYEVYVRCPLEECERRDPKGQYRKVRAGIIKGYTGIDSPYEEPRHPELVIETDRHCVEDCVDQIVALLEEREILSV